MSGIATAAMQMLGGKDALAQCRTDDIMADAAYVVLTRDSRARSGEFLIDEDVLRDVGVTDFEPYSCVPGMTCLQKKGLAHTEATLTRGGGVGTILTRTILRKQVLRAGV